MFKAKTYWIFITLALLLATYLLMEYYKKQPKHHNWQRTLRQNQESPYDVSVLYKTLYSTYNDEYFTIKSDSAFIEFLQNPSPQNKLYFYLGKTYYCSDSVASLIGQFVYRGGKVFLSANELPFALLHQFPGIYHTQVESFYADSTSVHWQQTDSFRFSFKHFSGDKTIPANWNYFKTAFPMESDASSDWTPAKTFSVMQNGKGEFLYVPFGEGALYIQCNPVFFSNFYQKTEGGREYTYRVISQIPKHEIWIDQFSGKRRLNTFTNPPAVPVSAFIQQHSPLQYAWYTLCIGVVLFLSLGGRRKQRTIPVLPEVKNNSLALVKTLGYFYYAKKNNRKIFENEWNHFSLFVKQRFHLQMAQMHEPDKALLSARSGVSPDVINAIVALQKTYAYPSKIGNKDAIYIYQTIQSFYSEYYNKYGKP